MSRRTLYALCAVEGAIVMALELLCAQILAPLYGGTLFTWGATIGVVLVSMASGYFFSRKISVEQSEGMIRIILNASAIYLLLVILTINFLEVFLFSDVHFFTSLVATVLFILAVPSFLLAMLPLLLIQLLQQRNLRAGHAAGNIFFVSTLAAIASCFAVAFVFLPVMGVMKTLKLFFVLLLFVALYSNMKNKIAAVGIAVLAGILLFIRTPAASPDTKILMKAEGVNGEILVADVQSGKDHVSRVLFVNRMGQAFIDRKSGASEWSYVNEILKLCSSREKPRILLLGLGGASVANSLVRKLTAQVDVVEFDDRVVDAAKKYFDPDERLNIIIDDARHFLNVCDKKYDFIVFDLFKGEVPAEHVLSKEALTKAGSLLNADGMVVINYSGFITGERGTDTRVVLKTVQHVFGESNAYIRFTAGSEFERSSVIAGCKTNALRGTMIFGKWNDAKQFSGSAEEILSDDRPILDLLHLDAGMEWRKAYYNSFTKRFLQEGYPLFE